MKLWDPAVYRRFLAAIAGSRHDMLRRQVEFLRAENSILRSRLPAQIRTTDAERRWLVRLGRAIGPAITELITIVTAATYLRWEKEQNRADRSPLGATRARRRPGRPRLPVPLQRLIIRIARRTDLGHTRILGELRKLGISAASRTSIRNILRDAGVPAAPLRPTGSWAEFLRSHADMLWACDFTSIRIRTLRGIRHAYFMVFLHIGTRRLVLSEPTMSPTERWVVSETTAWIQTVAASGDRPGLVNHDRDSKFNDAFREALAESGIVPHALPIRSPNLNAHAERVIRTVKSECLDRFHIIGVRGLRRLLTEFAAHYNRERPHSALGNLPPTGPPPVHIATHHLWSLRVRYRPRLGGVLPHFERIAA